MAIPAYQSYKEAAIKAKFRVVISRVVSSLQLCIIDNEEDFLTKCNSFEKIGIDKRRSGIHDWSSFRSSKVHYTSSREGYIYIIFRSLDHNLVVGITGRSNETPRVLSAVQTCGDCSSFSISGNGLNYRREDETRGWHDK